MHQESCLAALMLSYFMISNNHASEAEEIASLTQLSWDCLKPGDLMIHDDRQFRKTQYSR